MLFPPPSPSLVNNVARVKRDRPTDRPTDRVVRARSVAASLSRRLRRRRRVRGRLRRSIGGRRRRRPCVHYLCDPSECVCENDVTRINRVFFETSRTPSGRYQGRKARRRLAPPKTYRADRPSVPLNITHYPLVDKSNRPRRNRTRAYYTTT